VADLDEPLPFVAGSFDAALSHNVLECLREPEPFLAEVARVLVPGGHLLLGHADPDTVVVLVGGRRAHPEARPRVR
jgi:SAM-dependent methyltransferase